MEDIIEDATDDENEARFSDVYMDEDGNSIDSSGASDSDDEVTETQSNCSDEVLQRDGSYSHIMKQNVFNFLQETDMSPDKNLAVSLMTDHFMALHEGVDDRYVAPSLLITGGPGVGKSFLVDVFDGVAKRIDSSSQQLRIALFGVAAVNIDGASMCSLMDIPIDLKKGEQHRVKPWNADKLRRFKQMFDLIKIWIIVIDEISTVKPYMIGYLNARLQTAYTSTAAFGGRAVVFLGDFDQLPPAGGPSLPEVAMMVQREKYLGSGSGRMTYNKKHFEITSLVRQGVDLFCKATHIRLNTQNRSEDEDHTELLQRMSRGERIGPDDLKDYKTLSKDDTEFEFATILTPGNQERHEFNNVQARRWASRHKTNVVRWQRRVQDKSWKGKPSNPQNVAMAKEESCFWELFVPFALGYLTFNLNTEKNLPMVFLSDTILFLLLNRKHRQIVSSASSLPSQERS